MESKIDIAEKFAIDAAEKEVLYYIYCYYDKDLETFNQPQISEQEPQFIKESCIASIRKGKFKAEQCGGLVLLHLGTFKIKDGKFDLFEKPIMLVDCETFLKKEVSANNA